MDYETIKSTNNKIIDILNESNLNNNEITTLLGQLLIRTGAAISPLDLDIDNLNWRQLETLYYTENEDNDIGLGLLLNGGSIMQAVNHLITSTGNENAHKGNDNDQVSTTNQNSQKSSSTSTGSEKTRAS